MLRRAVLGFIRQIRRQRLIFIVTLLGFAVSLTAALLISVYVYTQFSYDTFHVKGDRIVRLLNTSSIQEERASQIRVSAAMAPNLGPELPRRLPEIEASCRLLPAWWDAPVASPGISSLEKGILWADGDFMKMFSFPLWPGSDPSALARPGQVFLTAAQARKYFGTRPVLGETLLIDEKPFRIAGVFADLPAHSHIQFDLLISFASLDEATQVNNQGCSFYTYLLLRQPLTRYPDLPARLAEVCRELTRQYFVSREQNPGGFSFQIQPLSRIHLFSPLTGDLTPPAKFQTVILFSGLAGVIVFLAIMNFINLMTAQATDRAHEIGVRKMAGAGQARLAVQFLGESCLVAGLSFLLAAGLSWLLLPGFGRLMGITPNLQFLASPWWLVSGLLLPVVLGTVAGLYPALVLARQRVIRTFKTSQVARHQSHTCRRLLVVVQLAATLVLLATVLVMYRQMSFVARKDLGFEQTQVLVVNKFSRPLRRQLAALKHKILSLPEVSRVALAQHLPGSPGFGGQSIRTEGASEAEAIDINEVRVDADYLPTLGIRLAAGRNFNPDLPTDATAGVILNQCAVRALGLTEPVGKVLNVSDWWRVSVIGVVDDFHLQSLHEPIGPVLLHTGIQSIRFEHLLIKLRSSNLPASLARIRQTLAALDPDYVFDYFFLDEAISRLYDTETRQQTIFQGFAGLATGMSFAGLFALIVHHAARRRRELSIRKVLGASWPDLFSLLTREYIWLNLVAILLAAPVAWIFLGRWLEQFAYRIELTPWLLLPAGLGVLALVFLTIWAGAMRTLLANPVHHLRQD